MRTFAEMIWNYPYSTQVTCTLLKLPGLLVESKSSEIVFIALITHWVWYHLPVHTVIHYLCTNDVLHSISDWESLM